MATLSVLKFNDPYGADRVLVALQGLQEREVITLEDAAIVGWPQGNRKPTTRQLYSMIGPFAVWGALWGFFLGMIFFAPFLGAAIGASMGGVSGALSDAGIGDDFIKRVREKVTEGTSALFALTSGATAPDKIIDELKQYDVEIISTNLPEEQENQLREAFAQKSAEHVYQGLDCSEGLTAVSSPRVRQELLGPVGCGKLPENRDGHAHQS